jgi:hypothetical protein
MRVYVSLRAHKYVYTCMHYIASSPHVGIYVCMHVFVYTCMQTSIYVCKLTNMHTCIHACINRCTYTYTHDASLSPRVPAQESLQQSADDAAWGRVPGPHVALAAVSGMLLHATWELACVHVWWLSIVDRWGVSHAVMMTSVPRHTRQDLSMALCTWDWVLESRSVEHTHEGPCVFEQDVCCLCTMYVHRQTYLCSVYVCRSRTNVCVNMCMYVDIMFTHLCMEVLFTHSLVLQRILANTSVCLMLFLCMCT